jgi:hypothetical protein
MDTFQEEVLRVGDAYKTLKGTLNPPEFIATAREVFPGNAQTRQPLEKFTIHELTYQIIGPHESKCRRRM